MHLAARVENILAVAHEGQRHQVDLVGDAKRQVFFVFGGQGANVERAARKVNAFVRTQDAADDDAALDVVLADLQRFELDLAVAEQDRIAFFHCLSQSGKIHRHGKLTAEHFAGRQHQAAAGL